jgi:hypothetical protein
MDNNGKSMMEIAFVIIFAILMSVLVSVPWENMLIEKISSFLFTIFLPGIWLAMQISGGPHSASEINVALGVFFQFIFMYWVIRTIVIKVKEWKSRPQPF